jgi:hypothetical protein
VIQRSWYRCTPNQTRTANQTTEIVNPTAGRYSGHLAATLFKADLSNRIDSNLDGTQRWVLKTSHLELKGAEADKSI